MAIPFFRKNRRQSDVTQLSPDSASTASPEEPSGQAIVQNAEKALKDDKGADPSALEKAASKHGDETAKVEVVVAQQNEGDIKYRTMSWQKCAAILFGEYVCLAILSFPWVFKTLGMAGGLLATFGLGLINLYTSMTLWRYCMLHPHMLHIADFGYQLFGKTWIAYELTALALVLNNTFIQGLHTLTGSEILNVLSDHGTCTIVFTIVIMLICFLMTLPRKLEHVAMMSIASAISMFIAILLVLIFSGIQGREPAGFDPADPVRLTAFAPTGTTFVDGFNAFLNIVFTWVGEYMRGEMHLGCPSTF